MAAYYKPNSGMKRDKMKAGDILINTNTFSPAHCGILISGLDVIHATNKAMRSDDIDLWGQDADIFRPSVDLTKEEVGKVESIAIEIKNAATYGLGRAGFKSTFSTHTAGPGLQKRLDKYRERLKNNQGVVKHVYCSELVILCYQLAWDDNAHRLFIQLDGKHTWPSTLRRYFKGNVHWQYMGEYKA